MPFCQRPDDQSLARDGLIARRVEPVIPPRVHYRLTPLGLSLDQALAVLRDWAEQHMHEIDQASRLTKRGPSSP